METEELGSRSHCLMSCLCLLCMVGNPERIGYRSLQREDCSRDKYCCKEGVDTVKEFFLESMARLRWRALANKMKGFSSNNFNGGHMIKRRNPGLTYDSSSYKLNFDDGADRRSSLTYHIG